MDLLYWSRHFRNMPGEGDLPVNDFMRAVAATGYDGYLSLEIFNDQFRGGSPESIAVDGHRSLIYLIDQVRRAEPASRSRCRNAGPHRASRASPSSNSPPTRQAADELAALLPRLGFRRAGRHISKDVTLYRQGDINIVVNTEREGFAHSSYRRARHVGLCHRPQGRGRARRPSRGPRALGAETFEQPVGPGELPIPAIRGVGGGVIYFIDGRVGPRPASGTSSSCRPRTTARSRRRRADAHRPCRPDHELRRDADLAALLHLDLRTRRRRPMVDVIDPSGVVRSQVIESDGRRAPAHPERRREPPHARRPFHRRELRLGASSTSPLPPTTSSQPPRRLQRQRLRGAGDLAELLRRPRGALRPRAGLADRLRAENILYDRDEARRILPALQRRPTARAFSSRSSSGGAAIRGYGAPNAPFRIAAEAPPAAQGDAAVLLPAAARGTLGREWGLAPSCPVRPAVLDEADPMLASAYPCAARSPSAGPPYAPAHPRARSSRCRAG